LLQPVAGNPCNILDDDLSCFKDDETCIIRMDRKEDEMGPLIGVIALLTTIGIIIKLALDHRMRQTLIDKGMVDEKVKYLYQENGAARALSSLKWALVLIGLGTAIVVGQLVPARMMEEVTFGGMFLFAGIGLLVYYLVAARMFGKGDKGGKGPGL
jgi:hypothetical protein